MTTYLACDLSNHRQRKTPAVQTEMMSNPPESNGGTKEELRHILLGSPGAIRQTIYLLHNLRYSEPALWTPLSPVQGRMVITSEQGEMMSLLRRSL